MAPDPSGDEPDTLICVVSEWGRRSGESRLVWPEPAHPSEAVYCVCWFDGASIRRSPLLDASGADQVVAATRGIKVTLFPDRPWPTGDQIVAASVGPK